MGNLLGRSGGTVDAAVSKTVEDNLVWVRIPPSAPPPATTLNRQCRTYTGVMPQGKSHGWKKTHQSPEPSPPDPRTQAEKAPADSPRPASADRQYGAREGWRRIRGQVASLS